MKALIYVLKRTIINYVKRLKEKPQKAIGPIFVVIWLSLMFLPKKKSTSTEIPVDIFVSIFLIITIAIVLYSLYSGTKRVSSKFNMSDVNLIFVSPIKPQTVMIYGIVKKFAVELLASVYFLYQIPNLLRNNNVPGINQALLVLFFIIFQMIFCNILKLFIFALSTKIKGLGNFIRSFIKMLILLVSIGILMLFIKGNVIEFFKALLNNITYSPWIKYIPIFGWIKEIAYQTLTGISLSYGLYMLLIIFVSGLLLYVTYTMDIDYYEDMLSSAEINEFVREAKTGKKVSNVSNEVGKKNIFTKVFKQISLKLEGIYGAKVLFFKHINEYRKRSFIFFLSTYSLIILTISILLGVFAKGLDIKFLFLVSSILLFFSSGFGGKIYNEISYYFIFLMPDSPYKKLFYGAASSLIKIFSDSIILFVPFGILRRASLMEILFCIVCYVSLGGMLSYSGLLAFRIAQFFGFTGPIAQGLLFMLFQMLLMVPIVIIVLVITKVFTDVNGYGIYIGYLIYSLGAAGLFSLGCVGIFNDMEFMQ